VAKESPTAEVGKLMRLSYIVPIRLMVIYEYGVPGEALNLNSTNCLTMVTMGIRPYQEKNIPLIKPGIETGTS
jgi:hypothetical protein